MAWGSRFVQASSRVQLQALRVCLGGQRKADSGLAHVAPGPTFPPSAHVLPCPGHINLALHGKDTESKAGASLKASCQQSDVSLSFKRYLEGLRRSSIKPEDLSSRTHVKRARCGGTHLNVETEGSRGSLASLSCLTGELRANEKPVLREVGLHF